MLNGFFVLTMLVMCGVLASVLVVDHSAGAEGRQAVTAQGGSIIMQLLVTGCTVFSIAILMTSPRAGYFIQRCWPLWVFAGLAILSTVWSVDWSTTLRRSISLSFTLTAGLALAVRYSTESAINLTIRAMGLICVLCVLSVLVMPGLAIHQDEDLYQAAHAGLWRGLLGHKVNLGMFAGTAIGLMLYYGPSSFKLVVSFPIAMAAAIACLVGSGSATGIVTAIAWAGTLYFGRWVISLPPGQRRVWVKAFLVGLSIAAVLAYLGLLNNLAILLGKSTDLTGRASFWPYILDVVMQGAPVQGYGYAAGMSRYIGYIIKPFIGTDLGEAHNGFVELVTAFGFAGAAVIIGIHFWLIGKAGGILEKAPRQIAGAAVFPFAFLIALMTVSYGESIILYQTGLWTLMTPLAVVGIVELRELLRAPSVPRPHRAPGMALAPRSLPRR